MRLIPNPLYIAKNQTASLAPVEDFIQPLSAHSSITEDNMWCPVRALKYYWHRTKAKRSGDQLFIITKEPFSPASRDTISKWIVAAIQRLSRPEFHLALTTPVVSVRRGRSSVVFRWKKYTKRLTGGRPTRLFPSTSGTFLPRSPPFPGRLLLPRHSPSSTLSLGMCLSHASLTSLCWSSIL